MVRPGRERVGEGHPGAAREGQVTCGCGRAAPARRSAGGLAGDRGQWRVRGEETGTQRDEDEGCTMHDRRCTSESERLYEKGQTRGTRGR